MHKTHAQRPRYMFHEELYIKRLTAAQTRAAGNFDHFYFLLISLTNTPRDTVTAVSREREITSDKKDTPYTRYFKFTLEIRPRLSILGIYLILTDLVVFR